MKVPNFIVAHVIFSFSTTRWYNRCCGSTNSAGNDDCEWCDTWNTPLPHNVPDLSRQCGYNDQSSHWWACLVTVYNNVCCGVSIFLKPGQASFFREHFGRVG
ncbi:unnamed protein product [Owenia fusiformis]|uniref:Uncharacterized protein n=1 Tax=Owenia fusiformis TaxID=6347 RepID=A0A8S4P293_OWEFU|nr:unnamed protein product [Owenia fusiformis]